MRRRIVAAVAAVLLAVVGGVLVLGYVADADERALAGVETVTVLVATETIPAGTPAAELQALVEPRPLPAVAVVEGGLGDVGEVDGLVTGADILSGEQLVTARFVATTEAAVEVPEGLQEVSVVLDQQRVVGGTLTPGDRVGVVLSLEVGDQRLSRHLLDQVLLTAVAGGVAAAPDEEASQDVSSPDGVLVTLALDADGAERVVHAAEYGGIWLTRQDDDTTEADPDPVSSDEVLR